MKSFCFKVQKYNKTLKQIILHHNIYILHNHIFRELRYCVKEYSG